MSPTSISSPTSQQQSWRPHIVRDLLLAALCFMAFTLWQSQKHYLLLASANDSMTTKQDTSLLPTNTKKKKITIAYAISLTSCNAQTANLDGAAILRHSIQRFDSLSTSKYDSKFYAFVHPNATSCADEIRNLGYDVQVRPTPINVSDISGDLKHHVEGASCCGSAEFLKLYAYTLTQHPVAVHLDMDVAVLKPMDDLYDGMIEGPSSRARSRLPAMWIANATELPQQIDAYFTRDYNMLTYAGYRKPIETSIQGGFMVVRPNTTVFQEYLDIILEGNYEPGRGWGASNGLRFGGTYGSAQIQGLVSYYYGHVHPGTAVELNRCIYNTMVDKPTDKDEKCLSPRKEDGYCEDCRKTNFSDVVSTHYTVCQKPWWCRRFNENETLCDATHKAWFQLRYEVEMQRKMANPSYNIRAMPPTKQSKDRPWVVNGNWSFCGPSGYIKMLN